MSERFWTTNLLIGLSIIVLAVTGSMSATTTPIHFIGIGIGGIALIGHDLAVLHSSHKEQTTLHAALAVFASCIALLAGSAATGHIEAEVGIAAMIIATVALTAPLKHSGSLKRTLPNFKR